VDGPGRAHQILQEAELEAQALVEAARQKAASLEQEGYREGWLQGRAEVLGEARGELQQLMAALEAGALRVRAMEDDFRTQACETIAGLALAVAERILRAEIVQDPEATLRGVRAALAVLLEQGSEQGEVLVRVHPTQHATIQEHRAGLLAVAEGVPALRVLPDPAIEAGGCLVEAPGCLVDATIAAQLEEARRRLREAPQ
jgi:flagellar assembly protein FliH